MSKLPISMRLSLLIGVSAIGIFVTAIAGLFLLRQQMIEDRMAQLENLIDSTVAVGRAAMKSAGGETDAGRKAMVDVIRAVRYGTAKDVNYAFAYAYDGTYLAHINPAKIGINGLMQKNPADSEVVRNLLRVGMGPEGRGFFWYETEKTPGGPRLPKVSIMQNLPDLKGVVGMGVYIDDVDAIFWGRVEIMAIIFTGVLLVTMAFAYVIRTSITRPLQDITAKMTGLAQGDLGISITGTELKTEIGALARALDIFRQNSIERADGLKHKALEDQVQIARASRIEDLNQGFDRDVGRLLTKVEQAVADFQLASEMLSATAEETNARVASVAAASEQSSANVRSAAAATEQLTASVNVIGGQVRSSSEIANRAVSEARATNEQIAGLARATSRIGEVVSLITSIASQTNLLALNATIEAARAGEAGRGFAIVASEVKNLATQTGKATEEISGQISSIQHETKQAVDAIQAIAATIEQIDQISASVADSVEEQKLATNEIAVNAQVAAEGTNGVSQNIGKVAEAAKRTEDTARQLSGAASDLQSEAQTLRRAVQSFLADVKAA